LYTSTVSIPYRSKKDVFKLTPIGDIHLGNVGCDEEALKEVVRMVAEDENHYTIYMGDMADCITPTDKRFDATELAEWAADPRIIGRLADAQYERIHSILSPIPSERVLGIINGNHENTIKFKHFRDLALDLARTLKIPYMGEQGFVKLAFTRHAANTRGAVSRFDLFATHGSGSSRRIGGKVNKVTDIGAFVDADIILCGHMHDKIVIRNSMLRLDTRGNLASKDRLFAITGTFLKTYGHDGYGARNLYAPTSIGVPTICIEPFTRKLWAIT